MNQLTFFVPVENNGKSRYTRDLPVSEQPVNRLREVGPSALSSTELLACLLQTPTALQQATEILTQFDLHRLNNIPEAELTKIKGLGPAQATRLYAAFELGRRLTTQPPDDKFQVRSPADGYDLFKTLIGNKDQEHFAIAILDTRNRVLQTRVLYIGSLNTSLVRVNEVFKTAMAYPVAGIIVAHNHPSGDPNPSPEDIALTRRLVQAGKLLEIDVLDHIIIGRNRYISLRERAIGFEEA